MTSSTIPRRRAWAAFASLLLGACRLPGTVAGCAPISPPVRLPETLSEDSGVAVSRAHPGVFWTHPDGSEPYLYAVDASGNQIGKVRLDSSRLVDWEDISLARCGSGDCLYLADTGDNTEERRALRVFRVPEPDPRVDTIVSVQAFAFVLPDGPRDVEAMFVMPGESIYLVSKGTHDPVSVYRHPGPLDVDSVPTLVEVQKLGDEPRVLPRQVTGASASPDGALVVIRTYEVLDFYRMSGDTLEPLEERTLNLRTLREAQGEGVGIGEGGVIALTSESGPIFRRGSMALVRCDIGE